MTCESTFTCLFQLELTEILWELNKFLMKFVVFCKIMNLEIKESLSSTSFSNMKPLETTWNPKKQHKHWWRSSRTTWKQHKQRVDPKKLLKKQQRIWRKMMNLKKQDVFTLKSWRKLLKSSSLSCSWRKFLWNHGWTLKKFPWKPCIKGNFLRKNIEFMIWRIFFMNSTVSGRFFMFFLQDLVYFLKEFSSVFMKTTKEKSKKKSKKKSKEK